MTEIGRREEYREPIEVWGSYRNGRGQSRDVHLRDLTPLGCQFYDKFGNLSVDSELVMKIDTFGAIAAIVRWAHNERVGVEFRSPLHIAIFDHLKAK